MLSFGLIYSSRNAITFQLGTITYVKLGGCHRSGNWTQWLLYSMLHSTDCLNTCFKSQFSSPIYTSIIQYKNYSAIYANKKHSLLTFPLNQFHNLILFRGSESSLAIGNHAVLYLPALLFH